MTMEDVLVRTIEMPREMLQLVADKGIQLQMISTLCGGCVARVSLSSWSWRRTCLAAPALTRRCLAFAVHLDTDEGNAVMLKDATAFELLKKDDAGGFVCIHKEVR